MQTDSHTISCVLTQIWTKCLYLISLLKIGFKAPEGTQLEDRGAGLADFTCNQLFVIE
jgi:hypothetical protein